MTVTDPAEGAVTAGPVQRARAAGRATRVFISYAHDGADHEAAVRRFWLFLRAHGVDARLDVPAAQRPQDWPLWMLHGLRDADVVLVIASPEYKRRAEGDALPGEGAGVQWEAAQLRAEVYADPAAALLRVVPVVLPGRSHREFPSWLNPGPRTFYTVTEVSIEGSRALYGYLTGQVDRDAVEPPVVSVVALDAAPAGAAVHTAVRLEAELDPQRGQDSQRLRPETTHLTPELSVP